MKGTFARGAQVYLRIWINNKKWFPFSGGLLTKGYSFRIKKLNVQKDRGDIILSSVLLSGMHCLKGGKYINK